MGSKRKEMHRTYQNVQHHTQKYLRKNLLLQ